MSANCPNCGESEEIELLATPAKDTNRATSLPDFIVKCSVCGEEWSN